MRRGVVAVAWHDSAENAFARMRAAGLEAIPVINDQRVIGLVEKAAARACQGSGNWLGSVPVASLIRRGSFSCRASDSLAQALARMDQLEAEFLAVLDEEDRVVGVIGREQALGLPPRAFTAAEIR